MPRPRKCRRIWFEPGVTRFKPAGIPAADLEEVVLTREELESVRLADHEKMNQEGAARKMNVSQPTFSRILDSARKKIADALINRKTLRVEGGHYKIAVKKRRGGIR